LNAQEAAEVGIRLAEFTDVKEKGRTKCPPSINQCLEFSV